SRAHPAGTDAGSAVHLAGALPRRVTGAKDNRPARARSWSSRVDVGCSAYREAAHSRWRPHRRSRITTSPDVGTRRYRDAPARAQSVRPRGRAAFGLACPARTMATRPRDAVGSRRADAPLIRQLVARPKKS